MKIRGRSFVVFSDDWGRHPSSCQHLFRRIAEDNRVLWVNTIGTRTPTLSRADMTRAAGKLREWVRSSGGADGADGPAPPVEILRPFMTPFDRWKPFRRWNAKLLTRAVRDALQAGGHEDPLLVTTIPNAAGVIGEVGEAASVYYCVDEFSEWPGADRSTMLEMEREVLQRVDLVVATAATLFDAKSALHPRVRLLRHGVDWERFRRPQGEAPPALRAINGPIAGFTGLIDARIDVEMVAALAHRLTDVTFVFIGPRQLPSGPLDAMPNIVFLPPVPYEQVPAVVASFDVAFLPYLENDLTRKINPLKLREFLASGRPVVATPLPEVEAHLGFVRGPRGVEAWTLALRAAIAEDDERASERAASVRGESWDAKAEEFGRFCAEAIAVGKGTL